MLPNPGSLWKEGSELGSLHDQEPRDGSFSPWESLGEEGSWRWEASMSRFLLGEPRETEVPGVGKPRSSGPSGENLMKKRFLALGVSEVGKPGDGGCVQGLVSWAATAELEGS